MNQIVKIIRMSIYYSFLCCFTTLLVFCYCANTPFHITNEQALVLYLFNSSFTTFLTYFVDKEYLNDSSDFNMTSNFPFIAGLLCSLGAVHPQLFTGVLFFVITTVILHLRDFYEAYKKKESIKFSN